MRNLVLKFQALTPQKKYYQHSIKKNSKISNVINSPIWQFFDLKLHFKELV